MSKDSRDWSVVISSCDYCWDSWAFLFHFLFKNWPDLPRPVYLMTNYLEFDHPDVISIKVGEDRHWGANTRNAFEHIPTDYLAYIQDDYYLNAPVPHKELEKLCDALIHRGDSFMSLTHRKDKGDPAPIEGLRNTRDDWWVVDLQAAFWKKNTLLEFAENDVTVWEAETLIRQRKNEKPDGYYHLAESSPKLLSYIEAIKGGFWRPVGMDFLEKHDFYPDLSYRPYPPQGRSFFPKFYRSILKRSMRVMQNRMMKKWENQGGRIQAL